MALIVKLEVGGNEQLSIKTSWHGFQCYELGHHK